MIIYNKNSVVVRLRKDGELITTKFKYKTSDEEEVARVNEKAKEYHDELYITSNNSNTGYRHVSLLKSKKGQVRLSGSVVKNGEQYIITRTINYISEYRTTLKEVLEYVCKILNMKIPITIECGKGIKTLKGFGIIDEKLYVYSLNYTMVKDDYTVIVIASNEYEAYTLTGLVAGKMSRIGIADDDQKAGVLGIFKK